MHTTWRLRDNCLFHCECLFLAVSSLPLNLKWGTGRRSSYTRIIPLPVQDAPHPPTPLLTLPICQARSCIVSHGIDTILLCHSVIEVIYLSIYIIIIKLRFVGISQADRAGLQKAPRWAKIWSKNVQYKTCLDFCYTLSLSLSLHIYIYVYMIVTQWSLVSTDKPVSHI